MEIIYIDNYRDKNKHSQISRYNKIYKSKDLVNTMRNKNLNTVILLWTLYYTKHRNWFHESLAMLEIFTKLPLKIPFNF